MGVEHDAEALERTAMEPEEKPVASNTDSAAPMDQSPSHPQRQESQARGSSHARGRGDRRNKRKDMGRGEWRYADCIEQGSKSLQTNSLSRNRVDKRARNDDEQAKKRLKTETGDGKTPIYQVPFTSEDIKSEERRPKHKVAVMIGYSGTGYKGMQLWDLDLCCIESIAKNCNSNTAEKTIEGDLFAAFVSAGAISKANSDDPKKSSFVRCARTDKGVHAAGNVVSLKLIVEDEDIVQKINHNLSPQIRVWGYERTVGSFSCYQECNSRIYEYLIPTHAFLPPHPDSYLGRKLVQLAEEAGDSKEYEERQEEVSNFWPVAEEKHIKPILNSLDSATRALVQKALYEPEAADESPSTAQDAQTERQDKENDDGASPAKVADPQDHPTSSKERSPLENATRSLRAAYTTAKKAYRIDPARLARIRSVLALYVGTRNFHNYTIQKTHRDPSAKRVIKSFVVDPTAILINDTEWLSLKVHGQSFMMHQIRKMVSMAALIVRCGCDVNRAVESYGVDKISIPKAPGLGLLLERPVFDTYNERASTNFGKEKIDFGKYEGEMTEFKKREIYERIFREEERENQYVDCSFPFANANAPVSCFTDAKIPADSTRSSRLSTSIKATSSSTSLLLAYPLPKTLGRVEPRSWMRCRRRSSPTRRRMRKQGTGDRSWACMNCVNISLDRYIDILVRDRS